jgi:DNA-directed RNA polymerase specialized sigma24 family protein
LAAKKRREPMAKHRVLREILRNYVQFKEWVGATGESVIEYAQPIYDDDDNLIGREPITISFWDLQDCLEKLSPRKRQAVYWNVIRDEKQKDVADRMDITTVSVGQYVEQAMLQLAEDYFAETSQGETNAGNETDDRSST